MVAHAVGGGSGSVVDGSSFRRKRVLVAGLTREVATANPEIITATRNMPSETILRGIVPRPSEETMVRALATSTRNRFRRMLEEEELRLREVIQEIEDEQEDLRLTKTSSDRSPDPNTAEGGSLAFEIEKELSILQNATNLLLQAKEAQLRLDEGTYGTCADCGKAIPINRLKALPHTKLCVSCSTARR